MSRKKDRKMRTKDVTIDGEEWRLVADDELGVVSAVQKFNKDGAPFDSAYWYDRSGVMKGAGSPAIRAAMRDFLGKPSAWKPAELAPDNVLVLLRSKRSHVVLGAFAKEHVLDLPNYEYAEIPE
jgi:hypothetical protein